jgi:hypothetical protein
MVALTGCGDSSGGERLESYVMALQRSVEGSTMATRRPPLELSVYPSRRSVQRPIDNLMISVFDFLDISRACGLGALVGERNSSLGLVMPASQRFVYEQALLAGLRDCRDRLSSSATDKERSEFLSDLGRIIDRKSRELPRVFWNATFASEEFESLFSLSGGGALERDGLGQSGQATLEALDYLQALYLQRDNRDRPVDSAGFEAHLNNIRQESYGGRILQTLRDWEHAATRASDLLDMALDPAHRCERRSGLSELHEARVAGWFADHAAAVKEHGGEFLKSIAALADLPTEPGSGQAVGEEAQSFVDYRRRFLDLRGPSGLWSMFVGSLQRHQERWERMLAPC